jgi:hypothetical protein
MGFTCPICLDITIKFSNPAGINAPGGIGAIERSLFACSKYPVATVLLLSLLSNGFSVLTSSRPGNDGGLRISYATLGAFMKYPKESLPKKPT